MRDMPEFETPLVWFSRLLLNLELGLLTVGFLLTKWKDCESWRFYLAAFGLNIIASLLVFLPYHIMEWINEDSPFNTAYLLLVAFSPCFLAEFMSYWAHFICLVGHYPLLVGFVAFVCKVSCIQYVNILTSDDDDEDEEMTNNMSPTDQIAYASVPTTDQEWCENSCKTQAP